jgi:hypothetical protein
VPVACVIMNSEESGDENALYFTIKRNVGAANIISQEINALQQRINSNRLIRLIRNTRIKQNPAFVGWPLHP